MSNGSEPTARGPLLAIGGAEDKLGKRAVLSEFVALAGGPDARIAVIPTASSLGPEKHFAGWWGGVPARAGRLSG